MPKDPMWLHMGLIVKYIHEVEPSSQLQQDILSGVHTHSMTT